MTLSRYLAWNLTRSMDGRPIIAIESDVEALRPWVASDDIWDYDVVYMHDPSLKRKCASGSESHPHVRTWSRSAGEPWMSPGSLLLTSGGKQQTWASLAEYPLGMPFGRWLNAHAETTTTPLDRRLKVAANCPHLFMQHTGESTYLSKSDVDR